ncbi:hypothetical protein CathTA2_0315 [Caldalkalibacillus thermarum TA2.A1]|uniref:Cytochrome c-type biogenesis protein n=1 Tax=Caldalkalibacillus thermarum (strain TA2.A1) TaxID=986075 RepID=F5L3F4_CALTT|nr:cytochrome c-type biogenesis protein [Caldalkalibacillus thermarum]EGL84133.1 hypothetical protein CathTA2_0315 [Caldalkalibacillus thermarum TA2.A1]QZT35034.1 cytochrome c-type biogenesis protein CcmH [Caldalkalibacillus thermarum TA2.A1]
MRRTKGCFTLLVIVLFFFPVMERGAAEEHVRVTKEDITRIGRQLYPPNSMGMTVDYCTLPSAAVMRSEIVELLRQGLSDEEVIEAMVERYDERILAAPRKKGFNWMLWVLPFVTVSLGFVGLSFYLGHKTKSQYAVSDKETSFITEEGISEAERRRIDQKIKQYLNGTLKTEAVDEELLIRDLADLEYDYLMEKITQPDYEWMRAKLYRQILKLEEGRGEPT